MHAWRYRYFLVERMDRSDEEELQYCQALIAADRSNFSAWHYRSVLLPRVHAARGHLSLEQLQLSGGAGRADAQHAQAEHPRDAKASCGDRPSEWETGDPAPNPGTERRNTGKGANGPAPEADSQHATPSIPLYELKAEFDFLHQVRHGGGLLCRV